jgi:hypothetical protein
MALKVYATFEPDGTFPAIFAKDVEMPDGKRLSEVEFGGGGSVTNTPTNIDLTRYATDGVIVEHYADESTVTHAIEFNADGKPVKVTTNGVTTTLEW